MKTILFFVLVFYANSLFASAPLEYVFFTANNKSVAVLTKKDLQRESVMKQLVNDGFHQMDSDRRQKDLDSFYNGVVSSLLVNDCKKV